MALDWEKYDSSMKAVTADSGLGIMVLKWPELVSKSKFKVCTTNYNEHCLIHSNFPLLFYETIKKKWVKKQTKLKQTSIFIVFHSVFLFCFCCLFWLIRILWFNWDERQYRMINSSWSDKSSRPILSKSHTHTSLLSNLKWYHASKFLIQTCFCLIFVKIKF